MAESVALNHVVTDQSHHVYRVSGEEIVVGFVVVNVTAEEDKVKSIMENVLLMNSDISFIAVFQPNSKCSNVYTSQSKSHLTKCMSPTSLVDFDTYVTQLSTYSF